MICNFLGDDVLCSLDGFICGFDGGLSVSCVDDKFGCFSCKLCERELTCFEELSEWLESFAFGDAGFGEFFLLIWSVEVFDLGESLCVHDLLFEFWSHESLLTDEADDIGFTSLEILGIVIDIGKITELLIGSSFGEFFTITRDKRDSITLI
jgi:hypothetical protein